MKTYQQFLTEGRDAVLYHSTPFINLFQILRSGAIKAGPSNAAGQISLTRNLQFAANFNNLHSFVLVLSQRELSRRYKITPYNDYWWDKKLSFNYKEFEEVVHADQIPLMYVKKILTRMNRETAFSLMEHETLGIRAAEKELFKMAEREGLVVFESITSSGLLRRR